jgi:serine/threonine protein kinase
VSFGGAIRIAGDDGGERNLIMTGEPSEGHGSPPPKTGSAEIPARVGKYRIDGIIGRGAVGIVYKGHDEVIGRPLAIKTLRVDSIADPDHHEAVLKRFDQEARSAGQCLHPNIVTVFDYVEQDGAPYIVMEFVDAGTLENVINSGHMLPIRQVGEIMAQLLFALDHAHSKGVIHRDVKPANILCPSASSIKVTDFGVARFDALNLTITNPGFGAIGTPNYMSPEQFLGRPVDKRSDLFSAGIILFQLLTGAKPFIARDIPELMHKLLHERPPALATLRPEIGAHLDPVVQKALARNPADRFQSADAFVDALNAAIDATGYDTAPPLDLTKVAVPAGIAAPRHGNESSASKAGLSQTMDARLAPETLGAVENELVKSMGPIAKVIVRRAAASATDPDSLLETIARSLPGDAEAAVFRKTAEGVIRGDSQMAAIQLDAKILPEEVSDATAALMPLLGPFAKVLAKREAAMAIGYDDYVTRLEAALPSEDDRVAFKAAMTFRRTGGGV